jgi:hypothetical protein
VLGKGATVRTIHVLRKPLSEGTVAANVLKHGTGGLNIDASRISTDDNLNGGAYAENPTERWDGAENWRYKRGDHGNVGEYQQPSGRWPANVILQHLDGCRCEGIKRVKATSIHGESIAVRRSGVHHTAGGHQSVGRKQSVTGHADKDGKETVANWICEPGCPVARLDAESLVGGMHSAGKAKLHDRDRGTCQVTSFTGGQANTNGGRFGDKGGASRFYKQVGGKVSE